MSHLSAALLASTLFAAAAEPGQVAVLGFGDCSDTALATATRAVRASVAGSLSEEASAAPSGGLPGMSLEEIRRSLEAGKTAFLNLDPAAEATLRNLLPQVDRLPLGPSRWELFWETRAWLARVLQHGGQKAKATELYLQVLRVDEEFQLSRVDFPPSSRDLLEMTRQLAPSFPRAKLTVTARGGKGQVYLNGFAVGPVPITRSLMTGEYEVSVADGAKRSFVRRIKLAADVSIEVDLEREGPFDRAAGPCYQTGATREERLKAASSLAGALGASRVVAVRLEKLGSEDYVAAALVEVAKGRETREGRVRREGGRMPNLSRLAQFALTGEGSPEPGPEQAGAGAKDEPGQEARGTAAPAEAVAAPRPAEPRSEPMKWQRPVSYVLWALALAAGGVAVYEQVHIGELEGERASLTENGSVKNPSDLPRYNAIGEELETSKAARLGLSVGAGVAGAAGIGLFVWSVVPGQDRQGAPQVTVMVAGNF